MKSYLCKLASVLVLGLTLAACSNDEPGDNGIKV